jgi:glycine cleavage system H protein
MTEVNLPPELRYAKTHEWARVDGSTITVGISDHAQAELTDIVFVDLPTVGRRVEAGASMLVLESVKTVADVYAPANGTIREVNSELKDHPEWVNQDPYGRGWLVRIEGTPSPDLLSADQYRAQIGAK